MPNGFHGSHIAWERVTAPLVEVDDLFGAAAAQHGFLLSRNERNWPGRSLRSKNRIERLIQLHMADDNPLLYTLWVCAFEDRQQRRYLLRRTVADQIPPEELGLRVPGLLREAVATVLGWGPKDLQPGPKLPSS